MSIASSLISELRAILPELIPDLVIVNLKLDYFSFEVVHFYFKAMHAVLQFSSLLFRLPVLALVLIAPFLQSSKPLL